MSDNLKDVVIVVTDSYEGDEGGHYAQSQVFRFDLEGSVEAFTDYLLKYRPIIHAERLVAEVD